MYLVTKKNRDMRAILYMVEKVFKKQKFRMATKRSIVAILKEQVFLIFLDMSEADLHVPILQCHHKFFLFYYGKWHF